MGSMIVQTAGMVRLLMGIALTMGLALATGAAEAHGRSAPAERAGIAAQRAETSETLRRRIAEQRYFDVVQNGLRFAAPPPPPLIPMRAR